MVRVMVVIRVRARVRVKRAKLLICPSEPSAERVKVSHVIVECIVMDYHPLHYEYEYVTE